MHNNKWQLSKTDAYGGAILRACGCGCGTQSARQKSEKDPSFKGDVYAPEFMWDTQQTFAPTAAGIVGTAA